MSPKTATDSQTIADVFSELYETWTRTLAGEQITAKLTRVPGNDAAFDGLKVVTTGGWFAARPSGTGDIYKIYAESCRSPAHLDALVGEARKLVDAAVSDRS